MKDLKVYKVDQDKEVMVEGVIIYGEGKSHKGKDNDDKNKIRIDLEEFVKNTEFVNKEQASKIMIKAVNFNEDAMMSKTTIRKPTPADLCYWYVTPERHQAYSTFWLYATILSVCANAFVWIYFWMV